MNIRQVRKKTKYVKNVKKITRSMQLVSAIKMKKAQTTAIEARAYQNALSFIIRRSIGRVDINVYSLLRCKDEKSPELVIFMTANKGLCGSFNFDLFRFLVKNVSVESARFILIGKKGGPFMTKLGGRVLADFSSAQPQNNVSAVFTMAVEGFLAGTFRKVSIVYNRYISTLHTEPTQEVLLPVRLPVEDPMEEKFTQEYLIEPSVEKIIDQVLRSYVEERIRDALIQMEAGEHSARMIAMKNATDNANDVIYNLTLLGNKLSQEKITNELLDMITAKESVEL